MLDTMLFSKQMRTMNSEFEDLLSTVEIFCNSTNTKKKLDKHAQELKGNGTGSKKAGPGKRRMNPPTNMAIPIQEVAEYNGHSIVQVCANSISSIVACNQLYSRSLIQSNTFLEFVNEDILSHGNKYSSGALNKAVAGQIQHNQLLQQQHMHPHHTEQPPKQDPVSKKQPTKTQPASPPPSKRTKQETP